MRFRKLWVLAGLLLGRAALAAQCVSVTIAVEVPPERAWELLSDFGLAHNYVPGLLRTEIVSPLRQGVGAHRRVYQEEDEYLEETIIAWDEGSGFVMNLQEGGETLAPFERAQFSYQLQPAPEETTAVALAMRVQMPWGRVGETLGEWFIAPLLEDELVQIAAGLKQYYETGQPATDADRERLASAVRTAVPGEADCETRFP